MRKRFIAGAALLLLALACTASFAVTLQQGVKWSQLPKMDWPAYDFSSEHKVPSIMASDWLCENGLPVTDVHWWGSYWVTPGAYTVYSDWLQNGNPGGILGFTISVYADVPAGPGNPFSRPGQLLDTFEIVGDAGEQFFGTVSGPYGLFEHVYQYNVVLPRPFRQEQGKVYWLAIQANLPDPARQWGWHESSTIWNDFAVQKWGAGNWYIPCAGHDMAFELTTIPEPASLLALSVGLFGTVGWFSRRRRT